MLLALLLQGSLVVSPMYLGEDPPPLRSVRHILLHHAGIEGAAELRTKEETLRLASDLVARLRTGGDFERLVREVSQAGDAQRGGVMGSFGQGMLAPEFDRFLFAASLGEVSDPIETPVGIRILQRIDTWAGVRHILVRGDGEESRKRCERLLERIGEGEDFAKLAREHSEDTETAVSGGEFAIYERGPTDSLLKEAAFRLEVGAVSGPLRSPLGWHLLQRVPPDTLDPSAREIHFVRLRGILVRFDIAGGTGPAALRTTHEARALIDGLRRRIVGGEDMAAIASEYDEDPGGRDRGGDLGWVYRRQPGLPQVLRIAALMPVGELTEPVASSVGFLVLRRER